MEFLTPYSYIQGVAVPLGVYLVIKGAVETARVHHKKGGANINKAIIRLCAGTLLLTNGLLIAAYYNIRGLPYPEWFL